MGLFYRLFGALLSILATARAPSSTWSCSCFALMSVSNPKDYCARGGYPQGVGVHGLAFCKSL